MGGGYHLATLYERAASIEFEYLRFSPEGAGEADRLGVDREVWYVWCANGWKGM